MYYQVMNREFFPQALSREISEHHTPLLLERIRRRRLGMAAMFSNGDK